MSPARLLWHLVGAPTMGAAGGAAVYAVVVRPLLPGPSWILDVTAVVCGTAGLLAGGVLSVRWSARMNAAGEEGDGVPRPLRSRRWMPIGVIGCASMAVAAGVLLAGVPGVSWPTVIAGLAGGGVAVLLVGRLRAGR